MHALCARNVWSIVTGEEIKPVPPAAFYSNAERHRFTEMSRIYKEKSSMAFSIIHEALPEEYHVYIFRIRDPRVMWEKIRDVFDKDLNPPALYRLHEVFHTARFNKNTDTLQSWADYIQSFVEKLASSDWPIDQRDAVHKLIYELPQKYDAVKHLLYQQNPQDLTFEFAMKVLLSAETQKDRNSLQRTWWLRDQNTKRNIPAPPGEGKRKMVKRAKQSKQAEQQSVEADQVAQAADSVRAQIQTQMQTAQNTPEKAPNDNVLGSMVENILQSENTRCATCHQPGHTSAYCRKWVSSPTKDGSSAHPVSYPLSAYSVSHAVSAFPLSLPEPAYTASRPGSVFPVAGPESMYHPNLQEGSTLFGHPQQAPHGHFGFPLTGGRPASRTPNPMTYEGYPDPQQHQGYGYYR